MFNKFIRTSLIAVFTIGLLFAESSANAANAEKEWTFTTGFEELDDLIYGFNRNTAELVAIVARTNIGKSWVIEKIATHIWQIGGDVGYISPEMDAINVGYRFDTLYKNFSNTGLMRSNNIEEDEYEKYIE